MKVKVTPPYPGAGSFEVEVLTETARGYLLDQIGTWVPASWCEEIPEITPEEGDICEFFNDGMRGPRRVLEFFQTVCEGKYINDGGYPWDNCRVLARKPKEYPACRSAIHKFYMDTNEAQSETARKAAYETFLSAILGVPYARVGGGKDE